MTTFNIYTGSKCLGNPGPGGYAVTIHRTGDVQHLAGRDTSTTPQRLELMALAEALKAVPRRATATIHLASSILLNILNSHRRQRPSIPQDGPYSSHPDLWTTILQASNGKTISWALISAPPANTNAAPCRRAAAEQAQRAKQDLSDIRPHHSTTRRP